MQDSDRQATAVLCVLAAFADGHLAESERHRILHELEAAGVTDAPGMLQRTLLEDAPPSVLLARLSSDEARAAAIDMARAVCEADGPLNDAEAAFLARLTGQPAPPPRPEGPPSPASAASTGAGRVPDDEALNQKILDYAILAGAVELLPQDLATMAVIPVQLKMVYDVALAHGYELDRSSLREVLAVCGAGLTAQAVEGFARRLLGGVARGLGGGLLGGAASVATGAALTFTTTWAIGRAAQAWYGGGRRMSPDEVRSLFLRMKQEATALWPRVESRVQERSASVNVRDLMHWA